MRISLFWKLFASYLGVVLLTALCVGLFATAGTSDDAEESTEGWLRSKLGPLRALSLDALRSGEVGGALQETVRGLRGPDATRYTVIAADGLVLADSEKDPAAMENHGDRSEVVEAGRAGDGTATRVSSTLGRELMYIARRVDDGGSLLGFVRVSVPARSVDEKRGALRQAILYAGLLALAIGFILCLLLARRFARPLRKLTDAAEAIAAGDYNRPVPVAQTDEIGDLARAFGTMATNLRTRIETISSERSELEAILSGMVEGVLAVDADSRVVLMNAAAGDILAVSPEDARGQSVREAAPVRLLAEMVATCLEEREVGEVEVSLADPPAERIVRLHAAPIRMVESKPGGVVVVMHDLTEMRRLERVRRDFVANASHELKTPVAAIRGLVETILEDDAMAADTQRSFLERARRQTGRLSEIIEEMLVLSKLEERVGTASTRHLDLRASVDEAVDTLQPVAADRGVEITRDLPDAPAWVAGTAESLRRIVGNLLDNAVKFTDEGTRVDVRVHRDGGAIILEIADAGPGIPPEDRERVFERFYRVDSGRSRDVGGTGLGLAIVKHLVQGLGGDVRVDSGPQRGSVFRMRLPAASIDATD